MHHRRKIVNEVSAHPRNKKQQVQRREHGLEILVLCS